MKYLLMLALLPSMLFSQEPTYYSQIGQDKYVNDTIFKNKKDGFFVDIGAFDGVDGSNSYFFEKTLGWKGICVEPNAGPYEKLNSVRKSINLNICIGEKGEKDFLKITGPDVMLSGLVDSYDKRHHDLINLVKDGAGDQHDIVKVRVEPLMDVLKQYNVKHIDFLSLDTEGGELEILKSIDFNAVTIDVITVENNYTDMAIRRFMALKGYDFVQRLVVDDVFKKRGLKSM